MNSTLRAVVGLILSLMVVFFCLFVFISNSLETHVVRTCCSSCAGLAVCALSAPCCVVNHFVFPVYLHYEI